MLFLLFILSFFVARSQEQGFRFQHKVKKEVIPFQLISNLIFIPMTVNGAELTFMLDTGVSETFLFSLENKEVDFHNVEKIKFYGLGDKRDIEGLKSINNIVQISKNLKDDNHTIFLILDEDFNISSHVGIPANGIIGYQFFKNFPVKIDYISKKITVYSGSNVKETRHYEELPMTIELNKPYIMAGVQQMNEISESKLLIDLGNSDSIWLFPSLIPGFQYNRPNIEDFLGRGFNGDIYGKRSRIHRFIIKDYIFEKPLIAMPDSIQHIKLVKDRKGSAGAEILKRFTLILNYPKNRIYLRKNRHFKDPFHINMSGMEIKHDGMFWDKDLVQIKTPATTDGDQIPVTSTVLVNSAVQYKFMLKPEYSVSGVRRDSPAQKAGIRKGDRFILINGRKAGDMNLQEIYDLMMSEEGKEISLEMKRNEISLRFRLILEDPIPYTNEQ